MTARMTSVKKLLALAEVGALGKDWYLQAHEEVVLVSQALGQPVERVAGVVSVLSPRLRVEENCRLAIEYLTEGGVTSRGILPSVDVALKHFETKRNIRGFKTKAFAKNLAGDYTAVVLDTHMATAFGCEQRVFTTKSGYSKARDRVERVARKMNWSPAAAQAAVWYAVNPRPQAFELVKYL